MGAGRVVYQELTRITKSIEDGDFFQVPEFLQAVETAKRRILLFTCSAWYLPAAYTAI